MALKIGLNLLLVLTFHKHRLANIYQNIKSKPAAMCYQLPGLIRTVNLMAAITVLDCLMDSKHSNF